LVWTASAVAAPQLRLRVPDELTRPVWVTPGSNGPTNLVFFAYNNGDGTLNVEADGGPYTWLGAQVGAAAACSFDAGKSCRPITLVLNTASLPAGTVNGIVQVRAPGALDAPQSVPITVHVGSNVPQSNNFYVPPREGAGDSLDFQTPRGPAPTLTAAGSFLRVSSSNLGSFRNLHEHRVQAFYQAGLANGANNGTIFIEGSSFAADNRNVPVTLNVTSQPISQLAASTVAIPATVGHAPADQYIVATNRGEGTLTLAAAEASTDSGGNWLSVSDLGNNILAVKANVDGLAAGLYRGTVRVNSNAANSPQQVEVLLTLKAEGPPAPFFEGIISNATTDTSSTRHVLSPGTIAALFGEQLSFGLESASAVPLPKEMAGTKVVWTDLNGGSMMESPLYFVSPGQINLQVPWEITVGTKKLQVIRDGQAGNEITVQVDSRSATLPAIGIERYGAIINATRSTGNTASLPMPSEFAIPGFRTEPARPRDVLTIFATGLGPVSPAVTTGAAPPSNETVYATDIPIVNFGRLSFGPLADPLFVGLSPGFVGLYQINVEVPVDAATNENTWVTLEYPDGRRSNTVEIAVER
jgi:uncharacterized protein (TIGR03437 family)